MNSVPHPENDSDASKDKRRRPSHFRKRPTDSTTKVVRVRQGDPATDGGGDESTARELWAGVANDPPRLPDPPLRRRIPPPAPLPAEPLEDESLPPTWSDDQQRLRRIEETAGIVGLAIRVTARVAAMGIRMTGG